MMDEPNGMVSPPMREPFKNRLVLEAKYLEERLETIRLLLTALHDNPALEGIMERYYR